MSVWILPIVAIAGTTFLIGLGIYAASEQGEPLEYYE